ncbi:MAG: hypothetical protein ACJ8IR_08600 [Alphaproteobacteria bacterium]|jgi:hypothetical protein
MRIFANVVAGMVFGWTVAQASPSFPPGTESTERALLGKLDPYWQSWVKEQARNMVSSGRINEDRARSLAQGARMAAGADVNAVSFLLLMQATRDADADLQATMDRSRDAWAEQDELSNMARTRAPTDSQLSPETQTVLSMKGHTRPVVTWRSADAPASSGSPSADVDLSAHLDLQTAMDHAAAAEDALGAAAKRVPPGATPTR